MSANTRAMPIPADDDYIPHFDDLPMGYTQMGREAEMVCENPACQGIYYQRSFITPDGWAILERTPCQCVQAQMREAEDVWQVDQAKTRRANITYQAQQYFGAYDLLSDAVYKEMTFDRFKPGHPSQQMAVDKLKSFAVGRDSICLYGASGRGKTHLALAVARKAKQENLSVLAVKGIDLLTRLKRTYDRKDDVGEIEIMRVLKDVDLLFIDDIGQEKTTDWVKSKFYEIIDYRHRRKSTIYTTNLTGQEMAKQEGEALVSRIQSAELCMEIEGRDYRMRK